MPHGIVRYTDGTTSMRKHQRIYMQYYHEKFKGQLSGCLAIQVVWDLKKGEALCGAPLLATDVKCFSADALRFGTCGSDSNLYIWQLDRATHKLARHEIQLGQYKRNFTRLLISEDDASILVGSTSGDVAQASPQNHAFAECYTGF